MSTMTTFNNHNLADHYLTKDEIKARCPLAFVEKPTRTAVSDKYSLFSSERVVDDLEKLGWLCVEAKQKKAKVNSTGQFSYHQLWFQNPNVSISKIVDGQETIECYPRIFLGNSADGLSCLKFGVGLYRCVCSNGLVVSDQQLAEFSVRHIYYTFEYVQELVQKIVAELPNQVKCINEMQGVELTEDQKLEFAEKALRVRQGNPELKVDRETLEDILTPKRKEDEGSDLWSVYNVIQEKMTQGGFSMKKDEAKKARLVKKITSFVRESNISRKIDEIARNYVGLPVKEAEIVAA